MPFIKSPRPVPRNFKGCIIIMDIVSDRTIDGETFENGSTWNDL